MTNNINDILKRPYRKSTTKKSLKGMTEEEKKEHKRKVQNRGNAAYQQRSEYYKGYRRKKWQSIIWKQMKSYIEDNTDDIADDIIDEEDDVCTLRRKFKKYYGDNIYYKYFSNEQKKIYEAMKTYIKEETDDNHRKIIDKEDSPIILRKKFKEFYGRGIYYDHISVKKKIK